MVTVLFWNVNRKPLGGVLASLAERHNVDILLTAECTEQPESVLGQLNRSGQKYRHVEGACEALVTFTRLSRPSLRPIYEEKRLIVHRLIPSGRSGGLHLAAVHLPSKWNWSAASRSAECEELARSIRKVEAKAGHTRTVLVGDLNMNPFEDGIVKANGLNATMTRAIAQRETRTVQSRKYAFFYNPMWGRFGDATEGSPGTYYYDESGHVAFFWHTFDQVLIRPALLPFFRNEDLEVLTNDGSRGLLTQTGKPSTSVGSDHLPILFRLDL
jgi:endonuclease/exonuclease/phosphatase (EEP) superfamily protein YafD